MSSQFKQAVGLGLLAMAVGCGRPTDSSKTANENAKQGENALIALVQASIGMERQRLASAVAAAKRANESFAAQDLNIASPPGAQPAARSLLQESSKALSDLLSAQKSVFAALEKTTNLSAQLQSLSPTVAEQLGGKTPVYQHSEMAPLIAQATRELQASRPVAQVLESHCRKAQAMRSATAATSETPSPGPGIFRPAPKSNSIGDLIEARDYELRRVAQEYDAKIANAYSTDERARLVRTKQSVLEAIRAKWERKINSARLSSAPGRYVAQDGGNQEVLDQLRG